MNWRNIWYCALLTCGLAISHAQIKDYKFDYFNTENGLAQSHVFDIDTDREGYVWLSTQYGLSRFDGYDFVNYFHRADDSLSLCSSTIRTFFEDSKGRCWVGTAGGLNLLDRQTGTFQRFIHSDSNPKSLGHSYVTGISEDSKGYLWIAHAKGVDKFDIEKRVFTHFSHPIFGIGRHVGEVLVDGNDRIWAGGDKGLFEVDINHRKLIYRDLDVGGPDWNKRVSCMDIDSLGRLWLGVVGGVVVYDPASDARELIQLNKESTSVLGMHIHTDGNAYIGTSSSGLYIYDISTNKTIDHHYYQPENPKGLSSPLIYSTYVDRWDNIWVGFFTGFNRFNRTDQNYELYLNEYGINNPNNTILFLQQDADGDVWLSTLGGLYVNEKSTGESYKLDSDIFNNKSFVRITSLTSKKSGPVYLYHGGFGLFEYDKLTEEATLLAEMPYLNDTRHHITYNKFTDKIILRSHLGLCVFDPTNSDTSWINLLPDLKQKVARVDAVILNESNEWMIVNSGYLIFMDSTLTEEIRRVPYSGKKQGVVHVDYKNEQYYIGTRTCIYTLDENSLLDSISADSIYPGAVLGSFLVDKYDRIWLPSGDNIFMYHPKNGDRVFLDKRRAGGFITNILERTQNDHLLFGCSSGWIDVNPDLEFKHELEPKLILADFQVLDSSCINRYSIHPRESFEITYKENVFSLTMTCLHPYFNQNTRYSYKLEGYQNNWIDQGENREAIFTNVPPGDYVFWSKVQVDNGSATLSKPIAISISGPFYQSYLFYLLVLFAIGLLAYYLFRLKEKSRKLEREKQLAIKNNEYKSLFLANMSHEIRTPLNAIIGLNGLMVDMDLNEKQKLYVDAIDVSCDNLLLIVNDILDQSKIESGEYTILKKPFSLNKLLDQIRILFFMQADDKGLKFTVDRVDSSCDMLIGDEVRVNQIIINIISNAIKFTDQGEVHLKVNAKNINGRAHVEFVAMDTGKGIPENQLQTIFEKFKQVQDSTNTDNQGTGLGLSIVKNLVEKMNGEISVNSELNKGSAFTIKMEFDTAASDSAIGETRSNKEIDASTSRILIVDDTPFNLLLIQELLKKHLGDIVSDTAENGKEAVELMSANHYDLVLMDVRMPVMDGLEATRQIRSFENDLKANTCVIGLTANAIESQIAECLDAGMNDCLTKPIDTTELLRVLQKWIHGQY